jgi:hypothetical protein
MTPGIKNMTAGNSVRRAILTSVSMGANDLDGGRRLLQEQNEHDAERERDRDRTKAVFEAQYHGLARNFEGKHPLCDGAPRENETRKPALHEGEWGW